jgi:hypothetical protein
MFPTLRKSINGRCGYSGPVFDVKADGHIADGGDDSLLPYKIRDLSTVCGSK